MKLAEENCKPLGAGDISFSLKEAQELGLQIPEWTVGEKAIEREFHFQNFRQSMAFVNQVADLAEKQNHHPDIFIAYGKVKLVLSTHKVGGLSRNDFILAAKIDRLTEAGAIPS
jgi:4a-hydroxytetrahydrobiopterin dehydratase